MLRGGGWADPVIIDLGLSRLVDLTSMTVYPWAGGTWPYMAPEQLRGERAIDRTDLWGLVVVAAQLAAGQHPFLKAGDSPVPNDWESRQKAGFNIPSSRPGGLAAWIAAVGQFEAYRRPTATAAGQLLDQHWPV
jgi:serine/threonine protein kinase